MRFKIDENLPDGVADLLRSEGYDAMTVKAQQLVGTRDASLIALCRQERRAIVTLDMGFSNIRVYPPQESCGIIVLRPSDQSKPTILNLMRAFVAQLRVESLDRHLWVVDEHRIRIR